MLVENSKIFYLQVYLCAGYIGSNVLKALKKMTNYTSIKIIDNKHFNGNPAALLDRKSSHYLVNINEDYCEVDLSQNTEKLDYLFQNVDWYKIYYI